MRTGRAHLRKTILSESDSNYGERETDRKTGERESERKKRGGRNMRGAEKDFSALPSQREKIE